MLGDQRLAITWIANELLTHNIGAAKVVATGRSVVPIPIELGTHIPTDFGCFGTATTEIV